MRRVLTLFCALAAAALAASTEIVDLARGNRLAIIHPAQPPLGSVILVPGGSTLLSINRDASSFGNDGNFVVRTRDRFVEAGYVAALVNDPADLRPVIARLRTVARPVFVVGTSRGTVVAARNAVNLGPDGPDGLVLTSSVTRSSGLNPTTVMTYRLNRIHLPVLVVANANDRCPVAPPDGAAAIARAIGTPQVTTLTVSSTETNGAECEPFSPHGYLGIEGETVGKILDWMKAHGGAY